MYNDVLIHTRILQQISNIQKKMSWNALYASTEMYNDVFNSICCVCVEYYVRAGLCYNLKL
jgi:hypothetical protein